MNTMNMNRMTDKQALAIAVTYAGIENDGYRCMSSRYDDGFFHMVVCTPYLRYEFYVDAGEGSVAGISTESVPCEDALLFPTCLGERETLAAA